MNYLQRSIFVEPEGDAVAIGQYFYESRSV
jgi:hypothetical protein